MSSLNDSEETALFSSIVLVFRVYVRIGFLPRPAAIRKTLTPTATKTTLVPIIKPLYTARSVDVF
eukprot:m.256284 g.256284  ORF g.256284 m.256284 type:complete len:65 (+) comp34227_c0_seq1:351-545(+)